MLTREQRIQAQEAEMFAPRPIGRRHRATHKRISNGAVKRRPISSLTIDEVDMIRNDCRTQRVIADDFNVSQATVSNIKTGKTWKHVPRW